MTGRLVGLQAQVPTDPYIGLWSRIDGFRPEELSDLIAERAAVRAGLLRSTIHLVSADDALAIQPLTQAVFAGVFRSQFAKSMGPDAVLDDVVAAGRELLLRAPRTRAALAIELGPHWPGTEPAILAHAVVHHLPLVQIPPRGLWGGSGQPTWALTPEWIGREQTDGDPDALVLRYLAAFGPASTADVRTWSRLTGLREVVARLKPDLRAFRDEAGRELLDVVDGPLPDPATPAPPRFLPQYDNVFLSHADRMRTFDGTGAAWDVPSRSATGALFVDGFYRAPWLLDGETLRVEGFRLLPGEGEDVRSAVEAEGQALLSFLVPGAAEPFVTLRA